MRKRILFVVAIILLVLSGAYLYSMLKNSPIFNKEIQCEVVDWVRGDLDIGKFVAKYVYVRNFKDDESSFEYLKKYAKEALPIEDPKDVGEVIFFDDKLAASVVQILPKINKNTQTGYPVVGIWPKDDPETIKKFKKSIIAVYFRLPGEEPKFIKKPDLDFENSHN
jgi:hypothetical protein